MIYLVRHGEAAANFAGHADPGLSERGKREAALAAEQLAHLNSAQLLSSPLRRAQETAQVLGQRLGKTPKIEPRVAEIPSPTTELEERARWLGRIMAGTWTSLPAELQAFRQGIIDCLGEQPQDTIIFSHFVAINLAVGAATDDPLMVVFRPANASITQIEVKSGRLRVIELGKEGQTKIN
ncbi:MAG: histidine phosphatase family protein [Pseudomonadales bacterium]